MKAYNYEWHCKLNSTISVYHLILITYTQILIFPLIYKYQQLNLTDTINVNTLCAHYKSGGSVLHIPCVKPPLEFIQV